MFTIFLCVPLFADLKVKAQSDIFFTQTENCYILELEDVEPHTVTMELPDLPLGTAFLSSKKEEFVSENGHRGTVISLWFNFSESGITQFSPLLVKINGRPSYFEFERTIVRENPALISPVLEIQFKRPANLTTLKNGQKSLFVKKGEKISFTVFLRYGVQILDYKWTIPKDSIFTEITRSDFANGAQKITQFTNEAKNLSQFEWQILKEGIYTLPQISVTAVSYNGSQKTLSLPQNIEISVSNEKYQTNDSYFSKNNTVFASSFEKPAQEVQNQEEKSLTKKDFEERAKKEKLTFFQRLSGKKYAIFSGGKIYSIPEKSAVGQQFSGGQKVKISEHAGDWSFIEYETFSGWTLTENLIQIK
ncbi:MAG: hypothetical protein IJ158_11655 [Treponema sp.]|nr:hypothetical protein [Treponema sp.]